MIVVSLAGPVSQTQAGYNDLAEHLMPLFPEVSATQPQPGAWMIKAPWMHSTISGYPPGQEPTSVDDLYRNPKVRRLPFWFHPPRPLRELRQDSQPGPYEESALVHLFEECRKELKEEFCWPLEDILTQSMCIDTDDGYDPLALFGAMQRLILIDSLRLNALGEEVKAKLESFDAGRKNKLLYDLVQVSYRVTRHAPERIRNAINFGGAAETRLQSFLREEDNHDVFARNSLLLLTANQHSCTLFHTPASLHLLIELLGICAYSSPLALATSLFIFEGVSYDSSVWTPWETLHDLDACHSRQGVGRHSMINDQGRHGDIGYELAILLPEQSLAAAVLAIRFTELCMMLRRQLFEGLYKSTGLEIRQNVRDGGLETMPGSNPGSQESAAGKAQLSK